MTMMIGFGNKESNKFMLFTIEQYHIELFPDYFHEGFPFYVRPFLT